MLLNLSLVQMIFLSRPFWIFIKLRFLFIPGDQLQDYHVTKK